MKRKGGQSGTRGPKTKEGGKKDKRKKRGQIGGAKQVQERAGMNQKRQKHISLFLGPSSPPPAVCENVGCLHLALSIPVPPSADSPSVLRKSSERALHPAAFNEAASISQLTAGEEE